MTTKTYDPNAWLETYRDTFSAFSNAQQDGFRALERFARFHYAVAGDCLEAGFAQAKAILSARAALGSQALADLLAKQAEVGNQLSEKLRDRAQEFSRLASEVQESVGSFATDAANRASEAASRAAAGAATGPKRAASN